MKKLIIVFCMSYCTCPISGYTHRNVPVQLYITPRNVTYGWYDNGVFQFPHVQKSIKNSYANRTFNTLTVTDSVYELYYSRVFASDSIFMNINRALGIKPDIRRIMIIIGSNDTMFIDRNFNVVRKNECYKITKSLRAFIEVNMPLELKESWLNNLPGL